MAYAEIAAIALPYVLSAMQDKPDRPTYQGAPPMADRSKYLDSLLNAGFNPQTELFEKAAGVTSDAVARQLGRRGLGSSSFAVNAQTSALNDLADRFLEKELERKQRALQTVTQYDLAKQQLAQGAYDSAYNAQIGGYQDQLARQQAAVQGMSGMAQGLLGLYQRNQMANQRQQNFDTMMAAMAPPPSTQAQPYQPYQSYQPNQYSLGVPYQF